jgi:hypothetical protein
MPAEETTLRFDAAEQETSHCARSRRAAPHGAINARVFPRPVRKRPR